MVLHSGEHCSLPKSATCINTKNSTKEQTQAMYLFESLADFNGAQTKRNKIKPAKHFLWGISKVLGFFYALSALCTLRNYKAQKLGVRRYIY